MPKTTNGLSVVICCYNSRSRLKPTLESIAKQITNEDTQFEVVIIDNNSTDQTGVFAQEVWKEAATNISLKVILEEKAGLNHARYTGVKESIFEYVLFCDDDNWLSEGYIQRALDILENDNSIAILGGCGVPHFETVKPEWFDQFYMNFAVGKPVQKSGFLEKNHEYLYGAGLVVRKSAFEDLFSKGFGFALSDRKGKSLSSGGDQELVYALRIIGYLAYFDESLDFEHFMATERMSWSYLKKLRGAMHESNFVVFIYRCFLSEKKLNDYSFKGSIKNLLLAIFYSCQYLFANKTERQFLITKIMLKWNLLSRRDDFERLWGDLMKLQVSSLDG